MALLSITDEISAVLVGLTLVIFWLRWPTLLGVGRWRGAVVLVTLALAAFLANRYLCGTLAPGGPIQKTSWLIAAPPRFAAPGLAFGFHSSKVWRLFLADEGSLIIPGLVVAGLLVANRGVREALLPALFALCLAGAGLVLFLCFEVNGRTFEGHRFITAGRILIPVAALLCVARLPRASVASLRSRGALSSLASPSSIAWLALLCRSRSVSMLEDGFCLPRPAAQSTSRTSTASTGLSCRAVEFPERGSASPSTPIPYIDKPIWNRYAGCRPVFAVGHDGPPGVVLAGPPKLGPQGFAKMDRESFPPGEAARVVCANDATLMTSMCRKALAIGQCEPAGTLARLCAIPANLRAAMASP